MVINIIKGFFIGIALVAPGLSGSMFAVSVGIYDKLLLAISQFTKEFKKSIKFLIPVVIGCVLGILASAKLVLFLCERYPLMSYAFFTGLVLGGIPMILKKIGSQKIKLQYLLITVLCFAFIIVISSIYKNDDSESAYVAISALSSPLDAFILFGAGLFSCGMMAIPGVSGAVMLMLTGQYGSVYNGLSSAMDFAAYFVSGKFSEAFGAIGSVFVCIPFVCGGLIGFVAITKPIGYLIKKKENLLYYGVLGLVAGAFFTLLTHHILPNLENQGAPVVQIVVFAAIGFVCTFFLDKID